MQKDVVRIASTLVLVTPTLMLLQKEENLQQAKNDFAISPNMAYGLVNMKISENERYVIPDLLAIQSCGSQEPRYKNRVGHESVVYDLPVSQSSPQPGVYALPHEQTISESIIG